MFFLDRLRSLATEASLITLGNVVYYACQWGFVLVLARLGTQEQVGDYALAMALTAPIIMFAQLQVRTVFMADVARHRTFGEYLKFRILCLTLAQCIVTGIALLSPWSLGLRIVVVLVSLGQVIEWVGEIYHGAMVKYGHPKRMAISLMLKGPAALGLLTLGMALTSNVAFAVAGLAAGRLLVLLGYEMSSKSFPAAESNKPASLAWKTFLTIGWTSLALGITGALSSFNSNVPRYFIEHTAGRRELGAFAAVASLLGVGNLVISSLSLTLFPRFSQLHASRDTAQFRLLLLTYLTGVMAVGLGITAVCAGFGGDILRLVLGAQYQHYSGLLVWMTAAASVGYVGNALATVLAALSCFQPQTLLMAASVLVSMGSCALLVPRYGMTGAVWANLAFVSFHMVGAAALLRWRRKQTRQESAEALAVEQEVPV